MERKMVEDRLKPVAFFLLWEQSVGCVVYYYLKQNRSLLYSSMFICQYTIALQKLISDNM